MPIPSPIDSAKLSDRELLLILHERVGTLGRDVHDLKEGVERRISVLESKVEHLQETKVEVITFNTCIDKIGEGNDVRTKNLQRLNQYVWFVFGALAILQVVMGLLARNGWPH